MPYLRVTSPVGAGGSRVAMAERLTAAAVELFTPVRGPSSDDIRARTTVHFTPYAVDELFIGGEPVDRGAADVTVEVSDWSMSRRQQERVAAELTPVLIELFETTADAVNFRFHSYPPTDFAVGGRLLSRRLPPIARIAKRLLG